jgi:hypothetical protein
MSQIATSSLRTPPGAAGREVRTAFQQPTYNRSKPQQYGPLQLLTVLSFLADADALIVDDDQAPNKIPIIHSLQEPIQCPFGLFDGGRPDPQPDDARMAAD